MQLFQTDAAPGMPTWWVISPFVGEEEKCPSLQVTMPHAGIHGLASRAWAGFHSLGWTLLYSVQIVPLYMTGLPVQVEMEIKEKEEIRWKERKVCPFLMSVLPNSCALEFWMSHPSTIWPWISGPHCLYILSSWKNSLIEVDKPTTGQTCSNPKEETSIPLNH